MAREFTRSDRVADAVQRALAQAIPSEIRDPRVGMVNVNSVDVSRDLSTAKIYITVVGAEPDICEQAAKVLNNAAGFLRSHISKDLTMRSSPKLQFYYDVTSHQGQILSSLIDKAIASDKIKSGESSEQDPQEG